MDKDIIEVRFERWALENFIEALNAATMLGTDDQNNIYHLAFSYDEYSPGKAELIVITDTEGGEEDDGTKPDDATGS